MTIEVISIGDEILRGAYLNTNALFICRLLSQQGWRIKRQIVAADATADLFQVLGDSLSRSSIVITTGGLGPTIDDLTRQVAAELFDSAFHYNVQVAEHLIKRYGKTLPSLENQATIPEKAIPLLNTVGTAPGLIFRSAHNILICLPGPPLELESMFQTQVLPYLHSVAPPEDKEFSQTLHLCGLVETDIDSVLRTQDLTGLEVGIYPKYGSVTLCFFSKDKEKVAHLTKTLTTRFSTHLFHSEKGKIEEAVQHWMRQHQKTLVAAESMTGGKLGEQLIQIPGASEYFLGSLVVYSNELKKNILHISEKALKEFGAVSKEVVKEMAESLIRLTGADYGIAISGIAGPSGGTAEKPVGTVWAALIEKGCSPYVWPLFLTGEREKIIQGSVHQVLSALYRKLAYNIKPK